MIKTYIKYLMGNFPKKLLNFSIAVALTLSFSFYAFLLFIIHYFQYLSVYFFNDLIDRKIDSKRKYILNYKLNFSENTLFKLGILHFFIPLFILWFINPKIAIFSSAVVLFGILRSYIRNKPLRELSLGVLQFVQILFFGYLLLKLDSLFENISSILAYTFQYIAGYASHKFEFIRAILYYFLSIFFLLLSLNIIEYNKIFFLFLTTSNIITLLAIILFLKLKSVEEFSRNIIIGEFLMLLASIILLFSTKLQTIDIFISNLRLEFLEIK